MPMHNRKDFRHLLGLPGFSDSLLQQHFEFYRVHGESVDALLDEMAATPVNGTPPPDWSAMKRRLGWEWNGMRLHELYFENLTTNPARPEKSSPLLSRLASEFGSFGRWVRDFRATGLLRGIGWAALVWDPVAERLHHVWIDGHDVGMFAGCPLILVLDAFEHAYAPDYGISRARYVDAFLEVVDWNVAEARFEAARGSIPVRHSRLRAVFG
jgi:Fe-Mn family superoxide dismutase